MARFSPLVRKLRIGITSLITGKCKETVLKNKHCILILREILQRNISKIWEILNLGFPLFPNGKIP